MMRRDAFGITRDGQSVARITLDNGALRISVLTYGATLQDVRLPGLAHGLTLGSELLADYEDGGAFKFFGAIAGPVANRLAHGRAPLGEGTLALDTTGPGGHCLHGGPAGLHRKVWQVDAAGDARLLLSTLSADGEGGFPGNRRFEAEFTLDGPTLTLGLRAETDAPTLVNLANHSYWNLSGGTDFHGHLLQVHADAYLPVDNVALVTGEIRPVDGTPFDFRRPRALTARDALDNNFCLARARGPLRPAARLSAPGGAALELETTEPGLQVYDARHMAPDGVPGQDGRRHGPRCGLALEAQFWPDAPNHPDFPAIRLDPGQGWEQVTRFRFQPA